MKSFFVVLAVVLLIVLGIYMMRDTKTEAPAPVDTTVATTTTATLPQNGYMVDTEKSSIAWKGSMVTGKTHTGTVKLKSGEGTFGPDVMPTAAFVIDMNSIVDADGSATLEKHLKSDDFFGVEAYPEATFILNSLSTTTTKDLYNATGDFTLRGVKKSITFPVTITLTDGVVRVSGKLTFNRADYNVKYGSKSFFKNLGDKVIKDEVEITLNLVSATPTAAQ